MIYYLYYCTLKKISKHKYFMMRINLTAKKWATLIAIALHSQVLMADTTGNTGLREERWTVPAQQSGTRRVTLEATVEAVRQAVLSTQVPGAIVSLSEIGRAHV